MPRLLQPFARLAPPRRAGQRRTALRVGRVVCALLLVAWIASLFGSVGIDWPNHSVDLLHGRVELRRRVLMSGWEAPDPPLVDARTTWNSWRPWPSYIPAAMFGLSGFAWRFEWDAASRATRELFQLPLWMAIGSIFLLTHAFWLWRARRRWRAVRRATAKLRLGRVHNVVTAGCLFAALLLALIWYDSVDRVVTYYGHGWSIRSIDGCFEYVSGPISIPHYGWQVIRGTAGYGFGFQKAYEVGPFKAVAMNAGTTTPPAVPPEAFASGSPSVFLSPDLTVKSPAPAMVRIAYWPPVFGFAIIGIFSWIVRLRRVLASGFGRRRCARCGYSLHGNVSGVCPECGQTLLSAQEAASSPNV